MALSRGSCSVQGLLVVTSARFQTAAGACVMKVLIAYDGSPCAEAALDDLTHAGFPDSGEALIVSVAEVWLPPPPPSAYELVEMAAGAGRSEEQTSELQS